MQMFKIFYLVTLSMLVTPAIAFAENFRAKAGVGSASYSSTSIPGSAPIVFTSKTVNLSLSYVTDNGFFIDFTDRRNLGDATWNAKELMSNINSQIVDGPARRTENTITIGKGLADGWHVFAGYQNNDMAADINATSITAAFTQKVTIQGLYAGFGKALPIGDGMFSATLALASMDATTSSNATGNAALFYNGNRYYEAGLGYSASVAYNYALTNTFSILPEAKIQSFNPSDYGSDKATSYGLSLFAKF